MSNYTKTTNFASKDNLSPGNPLKIVKGTEIDTEFNNIQTAVATKTDNSAANITGGSITGITDLAVADGGTGASTATAALNNLLPSQTSNANKYLQTDGTNATWDAVSLSTADITGTLPVANGGTGVTSSTGTGNVVLSNSPTLVTPALGTPSALVGTNITGTASGLTAGNVTTNANLTGAVTSVGNATSLGSFSSANLLAALTDETGTGSAVFATSPTLVTPALGTPSALVGTNITGTASGLTAGNVTTNANLTGAITSVGNATSLGSFSSANLLGALTDETGTGSAVFATSPTLVTPILGTPTSATLTNATGLPIATGVSGLGTGVATFLATPSSANLAAALTDETGSGANVFATSPTLVTPILGTPTSATLTNATGLPLTTGVTGTLPTANGGTNLTSFTSGGVVYASSSSALATGSALTFDGTTLTTKAITPDLSNAYSLGTSSIKWNNIFTNALSDGTDQFVGSAGSQARFGYGANWTNLSFATGGTEGMRLTSTGLGIGTSSPGQKLDVAGNVTSTAWTGRANGSAPSADCAIYRAADNTLGFSTASTERARIDSSGNLGLGVTPSAWNSDYKAIQVGAVGSIAGRVGVSNTFDISSNAYRATDGNWKYIATNPTSRFTVDGGTGGFQWYYAPSGTAGNSISFTQAMTLTAAGELLVGKTANDNSSSGVQIYNSSGGTVGRINCIKTASGTASALANYYSGTYVGGIDYSNTATVLVASSDERLKQNIVSAPVALEKLNAIEVVSYDWKHDPSSVQYGFVAQRLNTVYPEAVIQGNDGEEIEKTWGVEYGRLTPLLVKAMQEQQALIQSLKARLDAANL